MVHLNLLQLRLKYFNGDHNNDEVKEMIVLPRKLLMINEK